MPLRKLFVGSRVQRPGAYSGLGVGGCEGVGFKLLVWGRRLMHITSDDASELRAVLRGWACLEVRLLSQP